MKVIVKVACAAVALGMSSVALAVNPHITTSPLVFNADGDASFSNIGMKGNFDDYWTFTVGGPSDFSAGVNSQKIVLKNKVSYDINNFGMELISTTGNNVLTSGLSIQDYSLGAGSYALHLFGQGTGKSGGMYLGGATIAPVPEASTWVMMLAGLGLVGSIVRRRAANKA